MVSEQGKSGSTVGSLSAAMVMVLMVAQVQCKCCEFDVLHWGNVDDLEVAQIWICIF